MDLRQRCRNDRGATSRAPLASNVGSETQKTASRSKPGEDYRPRQTSTSSSLREMAIVFWDQHPGMQPGQLTRFDRLGDAIESVMQEPSAANASVSWIKTGSRHLSMTEIRALARELTTQQKAIRGSKMADGQ